MSTQGGDSSSKSRKRDDKNNLVNIQQKLLNQTTYVRHTQAAQWNHNGEVHSKLSKVRESTKNDSEASLLKKAAGVNSSAIVNNP